MEEVRGDPSSIRATSVSIGKDCPPIAEFYKENNKMVNNNRLRLIFDGLTRCGRNKQYIQTQDVVTFERRCINEGAEFYARGFTSLRTSLLIGLETGQFSCEDSRFKKKRDSLLPTFLYNAWSAIFDDGGTLRDNINVDAVFCLNQLLAAFGKIEGGHTVESEQTCLAEFLSIEEEVKQFELVASEREHHTSWRFETNRCKTSVILDRARTLLGIVLADQDPLDITPFHGSGVSACRTPIHKRYDRPRYIKEIDDIWSYSSYFFLGAAHLCDEMVGRKEGTATDVFNIEEDLWTLWYINLDDEEASVCGRFPKGTSPYDIRRALRDKADDYKECCFNTPGGHTFLDDLEEYTPCAKILLVPKDARGPRIISCEPRETMWIQQGCMRKLVTCAEAHPLTTGLVNFTNQEINQQLAFLGSINRELASLDLKNASDRQSMWLVRRIFPKNWVDALTAARSPRTEMPDGTVVELAKHAPMGSATCFPVMALSLWAILTAATNLQEGLPKHKRNGRLVVNYDRVRRNPVYVYGDDIIMPTVFADQACELLAEVGFTVNRNKSFINGFFRESCGKEFYRGIDITPVRLRALPDDDVPARMKTIAFHNNIYERYGIQPDWLTDLIHEWYPKVPERTVKIHHERQGQLLPFSLPYSNIWGTHENITTTTLSGVMNVYRADNARLPRRWNSKLQRFEHRFLAVVPKYNKYNSDRWSQVFRALVNPRERMQFGRDALSKRVGYKYRWAQL